MAKKPGEEFEMGQEIAPSFDLAIEGKDASNAGPIFAAVRPLIAGVSYEEDEEMATLFELTIVNQPDAMAGRPIDWKAVIDCKAFQEGNAIDLFMGYGQNQNYMGRVEIVKWLPRGGEQGTGTFMIKGYDGRHRMTVGNQYKLKKPKEERVGTKGGKRGRKKSHGTKGQPQKQRHVFSGLTDDQIVRKVAAKYGYVADCDTPEKGLQTKATGGKKGLIKGGGTAIEKGAKAKRTTAIPNRVQLSDQKDWEFLQRLAEINRFDLWVDYDLIEKQWVVHFKKRQTAGNAEYTFCYNGYDGSLIEWESEFAVTEQTNSVEVVYFDRAKKQIQLTSIEDTTREEDVNLQTATPGNFSVKTSVGTGARVRFTAFGQSLEAISQKPFRSRKEAEAFVSSWLTERERDFLILKAKVIGIESLRPRQIHEFVGMSTRCDGLYRLTQVKHVMTGGEPYVCEVVGHKVLSQEISRRPPTSKANVKVKGNVVISGGGKVFSSA